MEDNYKVKSTSQIDFQVILKLTEKEARALQAITRYGHKAFLEVFYEKLGKSDLAPNAEGIISLFETIKKELPWHIKKVDLARGVFNNQDRGVQVKTD